MQNTPPLLQFNKDCDFNQWKKSVKEIHKAAGAEKNCSLVLGDKGHLYYADEIWEQLHKWGL
ncbi:MAG: hypothetical protein U0M42_09150 [Acutalibacteraceae bacterium]|nr:hypothetical protein [Acutalibacteraceae bacterium]